MPHAPLVSVVIPTYNRAGMLRGALQSVRWQTVKGLEIIVVDDGSTDETTRVVDDFKPSVTYLTQRNQGVAAARNAGIRAARGRHIAFLDSDDVWLPRKTEHQLDYMQAHPEVGLLYGRMWSYHVQTPAERRLDPPAVARTFHELLNGPNTVTSSTVIVRRECFETVGVFQPHLRASEDHELWLRIARRFPIAFLDEPLAEYRRHDNSINADSTTLYEGYRGFYQIVVDEYRPFLDDPRRAERQLAKFEYLSGTASLKRGEGRRALRLISQALRRDMGLGGQFAGTRASWPSRAWLPLKPYAALAVSAVTAVTRGSQSSR